jgi:DNA-binding transcriptional ArsR family regulator
VAPPTPTGTSGSRAARSHTVHGDGVGEQARPWTFVTESAGDGCSGRYAPRLQQGIDVAGATGVAAQRESSAAGLRPRARQTILNLMVNHESNPLDRTFGALADPTRRALLARLGTGDEVSVSDLSAPFALSLPAVMKHLKVLEGAGLLSRRKHGRVVLCRLRAAPLDEAQAWLAEQRAFWTTRLDALAGLLED